MDESIRFYSEVMGFEKDSQFHPQPGITITLMKGRGDTMIELIHDKIHTPGFYSIGMDVDDINLAIDELKARGVKIIMGPVPIIVGSLAFIEDPNGVRIALIQHD